MKKKILFILHLPEPVHGAAVVGDCIRNSVIINSYYDIDYINLSTSTTIKKIGSFQFIKLLSLLRIQTQILLALFKKQYCLCYMTLSSTGTGFYKDIVIVFFLKLFNKKIIYHLHNKGVSENNTKSINNFLYKFAFKNSKIILLSPLLYYDVKKYFNLNKVYICPNGINTITSKFSNITSKRFNILFFSNMLISKGVLTLINTCKLLFDNDINFECHFVGDWSDVQEIDFNNIIAREGLSNNVFAHGKKIGDEKNIFFENATIFVLPTYQDCFPLVILEAMSYGLPIISTCEGAIPEIVEDSVNGFIIPVNDESALYSKIITLKNNPELILKINRNNIEKYQSKYTSSKFENNFLEIIKLTA